MYASRLCAGALTAFALSYCPSQAASRGLTTLYEFQGEYYNDGQNPLAPLVEAGGLLYGATFQGGWDAVNGGTIFSVDPASGTEAVLYQFRGGGNGGDGSNPQASLIYHRGILYGTTINGGAGGSTVFKFDISSGVESVLYGFAGANDGDEPFGALIYQKGILFGTTRFGGGFATNRCYNLGCGTVFAVDSQTGSERVLHRFKGGKDGAFPLAGLTYVNGLLYGTTSGGGEHGGIGCVRANHGCGTVFSINPDTGQETILHRFTGSPDGAAPMASLLFENGLLYGTTANGGLGHCCGTVFSVDPSTGDESVLYKFSGKSDGAEPTAPLIMHHNFFYGTTLKGGHSGSGTIFEIEPASGAEQVLYRFPAAPVSPHLEGGLLFHDGKFYGATRLGGIDNQGTVFQFTP